MTQAGVRERALALVHELGPAFAQLTQQYQEQIRRQMAFVKFVEHDRRDTGKLGLGEETT